MSLIVTLQVIALALWLFIIWADRKSRKALRESLLELAGPPADAQQRVLAMIARGLREGRR